LEIFGNIWKYLEIKSENAHLNHSKRKKLFPSDFNMKIQSSYGCGSPTQQITDILFLLYVLFMQEAKP